MLSFASRQDGGSHGLTLQLEVTDLGEGVVTISARFVTRRRGVTVERAGQLLEKRAATGTRSRHPRGGNQCLR
ncbi:hypothetical protein GN956_G8518 [Arapaima gigas]